MKIWATRIRQRREELGMTQDELSKKVGYGSRTTIAKIESGDRDLTQSKIMAFAKALDVAPGYILGWDKDADPTSDTPEGLQARLRLFQALSPERQQQVLEYMRFLAAQDRLNQ
jgi:transcriptional regulator with XRE-family HTH domain